MTQPIPLWTSDQAAAATGGTPAGAAWSATGVSIDSRNLPPGDLFVALQGPNFDGHDFAAGALDKGAVAALVSRRPDGAAPTAPLLLVPDVEGALVALASAARDRSPARRLAVTGSVGKTGVKEALAKVLGGEGTVHMTQGNLNNHYGVPLTLARLPVATAWAVIELGMNHAGELTPLSRLVKPELAIITAVEAAHLEFFGSLEAIADAKAEIFAGLLSGGVAVLPRDHALFDRMAAAARAAGAGRIVGFGRHDAAEARAITAVLKPECSCVEAEILGQRLTYKIRIPGAHWVANSLCVLGAAAALGADLAKAGLAMAQLSPPKGRGVRKTVTLEGGQGSFAVIDDSYNASPAAVKAALAVLGSQVPGQAGGRRILALGDMLELGEQGPALHAGLADAVKAAGIELVFTAGPLSAQLLAACPKANRGAAAPDSAALAEILAGRVRAGDVVLVKGSAGSRMGKVVERLLALDDKGADPSAGKEARRAV